MKRGWKNYLLYPSVIFLVGVLIYILIETVKAKNTGFETKTLWDWMDLLVVPLVLAFGAILLNRAERESERERAEERARVERERAEEHARVERERAEERARVEREIAKDHQHEVALQSYIDRMADMLLNEKLRTTKNKEIREVARIRTLSMLSGLDGNRKTLLFQFLVEAKLIGRNNPIVELIGADLSGANLGRVDLSGAVLNGADLRDAKLSGADLRYADLSGVNLSGADVSGVDLRGAGLWGVDFSNAFLLYADLRDARLRGVNLSGANLRNANLSGVDLSGVDLSWADLSGAKVDIEELEKAKSLRWATMPDGTKN